MSAIHEVIRDNEQDTPEATAEAVCAAIGLPAKWRDLFFPLLRDECRRTIRVAARLAESSPDDYGQAPTAAHNGSAGSSGDRTSYLSERFATGDGRYVRWGEATVADHTMRVEMLAKLRGGIDATIGRHLEAIELLNTTGARCLDETTAVAA